MIPKILDENKPLSLRVLPTDKFKAGMLSLSAVLPISGESAYLTSLLMSVLLRGTQKYPSLEAINRRLDYLYGTELTIRNFYRGDVQVIGFSAELLDAAYLPDKDPIEDILEVVEQILFHPLLDENGLLLEKYVESEKKLQCDSIRSIKNNPRVYASEQLRALLYRTEPCGVPIYGTEEELMAVTPARLTAHWKALLETLSIDCFYVGSMDAEFLLQCLNRTVGKSLHIDKKPPYPRACAPVPRKELPQQVSETIEAGQSHLLMAWRCDATLNDPAHAARMVFNELFGASPVSRLFLNVREKLSLCYSCSSAYVSYKGTLRMSCGLHRDNRAAAQEEIERQMQALCNGEFSDDEVEIAKKSLRHYMRQLEDSPSALESFYYGRTLANNSETVQSLRDALERVTREDVVRVAREFSLHTVYFLEGTLNEQEEDDDEN